MKNWLSIIADTLTKRWLPLLCVVILLHVFIVHRAFSSFFPPVSSKGELPHVTVALRALPEPPAPAPASPPAPPPVPSVVKPDVQPKAPPSVSSQAAGNTKPQISAASRHTPASNTASPEPSKSNQTIPKLPVYLINPPPSAELKYRIESRRSVGLDSGSASIRWLGSLVYFKVQGEYLLPDSKVLSFESEGGLAPNGLAPWTYTEKRNASEEFKTQFHREGGAIIFSASANSYPRHGNEQDTASVIWQLSGIARHGSIVFQPDAELQIFVAGSTQGGAWLIRVIGPEQIDTPMGKMLAWHLVRSAPTGSTEASLDLWLAPEREWYPVKLRYSEANGDTLDLSVSEITPVPDT